MWCGSGNVAGALPAAGVDLTPRNSPPEPTCAGSSCPSVSPPVPTLSLSRDLGGLSSGRAGGGDVGCNGEISGCNGGTGRSANVLCLWGCSWWCELQTSRQGQHPEVSRTPTPVPSWSRPWGCGGAVSPETLTPGQAPGWICGSHRHPSPPSCPLTICTGLTRHQALTQVPAWTWGPPDCPARTASGHGVAAALASSWHPGDNGAPAPPAQGGKHIHCCVLQGASKRWWHKQGGGRDMGV